MKKTALVDFVWFSTLAICLLASLVLWRSNVSVENVRVVNSVEQFRFHEVPEFVIAGFRISNQSWWDVSVISFRSMCDCIETELPVLIPSGREVEVEVKVNCDRLSFPDKRNIVFFTNPSIGKLEGTIEFFLEPTPEISEHTPHELSVSRDVATEFVSRETSPRSVLENKELNEPKRDK